MKKAINILEAVYCDGQISGANSTAKTNYANVDEAMEELKELMPSRVALEKVITKEVTGHTDVIKDIAKSIHKLITERLG